MRLATFVSSNGFIVLGYLFLAFFVVPYMQIRLRTRWWGAVFFIMCALTHLELMVHGALREPLGLMDGDISYHMVVVHLIQAISVWGFVTNLYKEFVVPNRKVDENVLGGHS